jgi:hypothetical protein
VPDLALAAPEGGHFFAFLRRLFLFTKRRLYHAFFMSLFFDKKKTESLLAWCQRDPVFEVRRLIRLTQKTKPFW